MTRLLKRLDDGLARGEAALAAVILLFMILLAAAQALLYNLATRGELALAQDALLSLGWIDDFLQKGTLWLAFLGASLATHKDQHIAIDALQRVMPERMVLVTKVVVTAAASVTCFFLSRVFFSAALGAQERPLDYELLGDDGPVHICAGTAQQLADASLSRPGAFCAVRDFMVALGAPIETPVGALQLIVPVMFLLMSVRFAGRVVSTFRAIGRGEGLGQTAPDPGAARAGEKRG